MRELERWPSPERENWLSLKIFAIAIVGSLLVIGTVFSFAFPLGPVVTKVGTVNLIFSIIGILAVPCAYLVPRFTVDGPSRENVTELMSHGPATDATRVSQTFALFKSRTVMAFAILNGAAMLNLIGFFMLGFQAINLFALLLPAITMLGFMPTRVRWYNWLDRMTD